MPRTLIVTNDFPPPQGGIEAFIQALADRFDPKDVVVYSSDAPGSLVFDAGRPYKVIRDRRHLLLPTRRVKRRVAEVLREEHCDRVLFGASAPLALLAPTLREAGAQRIVGITHSAETWWSRLPIARRVIRTAGDTTDMITYINDWCGSIIARSMSPAARKRMRRLSPGADVTQFKPGVGGAKIRQKLGIAADAPVVVCAARVVPRKGQDTLIKAWPAVRKQFPAATLLIVGDGPYRPTLDRLVERLGLGSSVVFSGPVPWADVPPYVDAGDVFAMPSRTRLFGLEPEGLPLAFFEGAACGLPVIVGRSGGAPDAIEEGLTGFSVDPTDPDDSARRIIQLFSDRDLAREMGRRGRERVAAEWTWDHTARLCRRYLGYEDA